MYQDYLTAAYIFTFFMLGILLIESILSYKNNKKMTGSPKYGTKEKK